MIYNPSETKLLQEAKSIDASVQRAFDARPQAVRSSKFGLEKKNSVDAMSKATN